jgi:hypothetical protein
VNGIVEKAHRASYRLHHGEMPNERVICHKCDVTLCVNPDHLFTGTSKENSVDMVLKRRQASKLTEIDVKKIRLSTKTQRELVKEFCVSQQTISKILRRKLWAHVE